MTEIRESDKIHLHALGVLIEDGQSVLGWYVQNAKEQASTIDTLITAVQKREVEHRDELWWWKFAALALGAWSLWSTVMMWWRS